MKSIAFFGATGGCTLNCLIPALQAGHRCSALVRSPDKLHALLLHHHDVTVPTANLAVIQGSIDDAAAVRRTLIGRASSAPSSSHAGTHGDAEAEADRSGDEEEEEEGELVDFIISGVGGVPRFDNPLRPTLDNPTVCQDAVRNVLDACRALQSRRGTRSGSGSGSTSASASARPNLPTRTRAKPYLIVVSTTGIAGKRDIPIAMVPLYHWLLRVPHEDKRVMEEVVRGEMRKGQDQTDGDGDRDGSVLSGYTIIRPSLLTSGEGVGTGRVRFGVDDDAAIGYTIARRDVGAWMFERVLEREGGEFNGRVVSLTA